MSDASKSRPLWLELTALVVVVLVVVIVLAARHQGNPSKLDAEPTGDQVKIELRAKPFAQIAMNGKALGRTPLSVVVKRGTTPIEFQATFTVDKYRLKDKQKFTSVLKETRVVVPDANQSVDFNVDDAAASQEPGK